MNTYIDTLRKIGSLSESEAYDLQKNILENKLSLEMLVELFTLLDRPLTENEFYGFYKASREAMVPVAAPHGLLDTAGTGSDGLHTINISSIAAILLAALGVPVAKHGNRAASSKCGSADVLEELGMNIDLDPEQVARSISATNFGFMFAPKFHPAFKHVAPARKAYGKRTYFNFLGPFLNPANADFRLVGVYDLGLVELMGSTLLKAGVRKAWVVRGRDGMDEISACAITDVTEFASREAVRSFTIDPSVYGLSLAAPDNLRGGDKALNANIAKKILGGEGTEAQNNAVILNTAAGLLIVGKVATYADGIVLAQNGLQQKLGLQKLAGITALRV